MKNRQIVHASSHVAAGLAPRVGWLRRGASPAAKWGWALFVAAMALAGSTSAAEPPQDIDVRRLAAAGLRVLDGKYVRLVTDLPSSAAIDELPAVFDAAVPLWAKYFDVPAARIASAVRGAKWLGFIVDDRQKFAALGLMPAERSDFPSGYARGMQFWLVEQPSDYYRRHLMLHEGTHAFMHTVLGGAGAPWYMEGTAELLGTHEWHDGKLKLGVMPANRDDVPMWGRIKLVRDAVAAGAAWPLERVLSLDASRAMPTDEYAWVWALAALLDGHPQFRERFRALPRRVTEPKFNDEFRGLFGADARDLAAEWQAFIAELDYGYDIPTLALVHAEAAPVERASRRSTIVANRGWQSAGWILRGGVTYRVRASGRYQLARDGETWPCEPGGVTLEYHDGMPAGALIGALRPVSGAATFAHPTLLGLDAAITAESDAELYVRVNDAPASISKNRGQLQVNIQSTRP